MKNITSIIQYPHTAETVEGVKIHVYKTIHTLIATNAVFAMNYSSIWAKISPTKATVSYFLGQYGHLLKWNNQTGTILEVGCADGTITKEILFPFLQGNVGRLVAIDKLPGMIDFARKENSNDKIDFRTMDIMEEKGIEEMKELYDHVFAFFVAHWIPDTRKFLSYIRKVLKKDGQIFLTILSDEHPLKRSFAKQFEMGLWSEYIPQEPVFAEYTNEPTKYVRNLFEEVGFKVEACEVKMECPVVEEFPDLLRPAIHMYEHLDRIPQNLREDFFQFHIKNCCEVSKHLGEPNKYQMSYETLICVATKVE